MKGIIWLWKHRHCWEDMKLLWDHRTELKRIVLKLHLESIFPRWKDETKAELAEQGQECWEWLSGVGQLKLARPWKIPPRPSRPQPLPGSSGRIEKALVFPTTDEPNPFEARLDPAKELKWPKPPPSKRVEIQWAIDAGRD